MVIVSSSFALVLLLHQKKSQSNTVCCLYLCVNVCDFFLPLRDCAHASFHPLSCSVVTARSPCSLLPVGAPCFAPWSAGLRAGCCSCCLGTAEISESCVEGQGVGVSFEGAASKEVAGKSGELCLRLLEGAGGSGGDCCSLSLASFPSFNFPLLGEQLAALFCSGTEWL